VHAFSGRQAYRIVVTGQNLHSLTPRCAHGAVEAGLLLLDRMRPLIERVNAEVDELEARGQPRMRVTGIDCAPRAADHHQALWCEIGIHRRVQPSTDPAAAIAEVRAVVAEHNRAHPDNPAELTVLRDVRPVLTPVDHPVVTGLQRAVRVAVGEEPTLVGIPAAVGISELLSQRAIPTVLFGYGILNLHHAIDEHITADALVKTAGAYAIALMEWLGTA
jgi:acetylornithine deacetylase/succinyl-diaminopimelate desuccinylase-like protein